MSTFQGRNSHAQHNSNAGGFAGRTIDDTFVSRELAARGGSGFNAETATSVTPHDDEGNAVLYPVPGGGYRKPHFEVVRSLRRDIDTYPNANSFRLKFSQPLKSVFAIQVMDIIVPNVDSTVPLHNEFLLVNGLFDTAGTFSAQGNISGDRLFHSTMTHNANDSAVVRSAGSTAANNLFQWDSYALASFEYDASRGHQSWSRDGWHRTLFFEKPLGQLDFIDLSLVDQTGARYDFTANEEWKCTLQIFCKN